MRRDMIIMIVILAVIFVWGEKLPDVSGWATEKFGAVGTEPTTGVTTQATTEEATTEAEIEREYIPMFEDPEEIFYSGKYSENEMFRYVVEIKLASRGKYLLSAEEHLESKNQAVNKFLKEQGGYDLLYSVQENSFEFENYVRYLNAKPEYDFYHTDLLMEFYYFNKEPFDQKNNYLSVFYLGYRDEMKKLEKDYVKSYYKMMKKEKDQKYKNYIDSIYEEERGMVSKIVKFSINYKEDAKFHKEIKGYYDKCKQWRKAGRKVEKALEKKEKEKEERYWSTMTTSTTAKKKYKKKKNERDSESYDKEGFYEDHKDIYDDYDDAADDFDEGDYDDDY